MIDILKKEKTAIAVIILALIVFFAAFWWLNSDKAIAEQGSEYVEYEKGTVVTVLSDTLEQDPASDNAFRGEQMLTVKVQSGQYKGEELLTYNYAGPLYGVPLKEGDFHLHPRKRRPSGCGLRV